MIRIYTLCLATLCSIGTLSAQTGVTCQGAIPIAANPTCTSTSHQISNTQQQMWFKFTATAPNVRVANIPYTLTLLQTPQAHLHTLALYGGPCGSTLIKIDRLDVFNGDPTFASDNGQEFLEITATGLTTGATYYVLVEHNSATSCVKCPIGGDPWFALCVQNIDILIPPDNTIEPPSTAHAYFVNEGQVLDENGNQRPDVLLATVNTSPKVVVQKSTLSFVQTRIDTSDSNPDTLHRMDMILTGAEANPIKGKPFCFEETETTLNYFLSHIPNGKTGIKGFQRAVYPDVYPNIDFHATSNTQGMKFSFVVNPGGNADNITIKFDGADAVTVTPNGGLIVQTSLGDIDFDPGHAYRINPSGNIVPMPWQAEFVQIGYNEVAFDIKNYPPNSTLIIQMDRGHSVAPASDDWSTFYGTNDFDVGNDIVTDAQGNAYFTGMTGGALFPNITGSTVQPIISAGTRDVFVIKMDKDGVTIWGTFYGGNAQDEAKGIALNSLGDVYIVGETRSSDFPLEPPGNTSLNNLVDGFIVRLSNDGKNKLFARYFGGDATTDEVRSVTVDGNDNVYMVGTTISCNGFPTTPKPGAYNQGACGGLGDGFIAEFDASNTLRWCSFFGGPEADDFATVRTDPSGNVFISGSTNSDVPASTNAINPPCGVPNPGYFPDCLPTPFGHFQIGFGGGFRDAILVQFDPNGQLVWSTYIGGQGTESSQNFKNALVINPSAPDIMYLVFSTDETTNLPTQGTGYIQTKPIILNNSMYYIARFDSRNITWATFFGCGGVDLTLGNGITMDNKGNVYVAGMTRCSTPTTQPNYCTVPPDGEFPICIGGDVYFQDDGAGNAVFGGGQDEGFITAFDSNNELIWSTYYGGDDDERISAITYDPTFERIYITGRTQSISGFPLRDPQTGNYQQNSNAGGLNNMDGFLARLKVNTINFPTAITGVSRQESKPIHIYPNPATNELYVQLENHIKGNIDITLYNSIGAIILEQTYTTFTNAHTENKIDLSHVARGIYVLQLTTSEMTYTSKLVIR